MLREVGDEVREVNRQYRVRDEDLSMFEKVLSTRARSTAKDYRIYLMRALRDLDYILTPEKLSEYILELRGE